MLVVRALLAVIGGRVAMWVACLLYYRRAAKHQRTPTESGKGNPSNIPIQKFVE